VFDKRISKLPTRRNVFEERRYLDMQKLRRGTEASHQAIEGTSPLMGRNLDEAQYIQCLHNMYGVVAAWEECSVQFAPAWLQATLARGRKGFLEEDLARFGVFELDVSRPTLPDLKELPDLLGAMYVMEGSTLGGQIIARHVETVLHLSEGPGCSYFRGHGDQTGPMWKEFCDLLKLRVLDDQTDAVIDGANAMFETVGQWMQRKSVMDAT
jgi:heme oxygenase (biliverdin-IX-beta and delta-forming)